MKLTLIFILMGLTSLAHPCINIRLDKDGGPLSKIPIYDQDSFGSCYAYTAAQLIDAYRFKKNPKLTTLTSPISLTVSYAVQERPSVIREDLEGKSPGGEVHQAINAARNQKLICDKKVTDAILARQTEREFYQKFLKYFRDHQAELNGRSNWEKVKSHFQINYSHAVKEIQCQLQNSTLPAELVPSLEVINTMLNSGVNDAWFLDKMLKGICKADSVDLSALPEPHYEDASRKAWSPSKRTGIFQNSLNRLLNKTNPLPIGVGFCAKVFKKDWAGITRDQARDNDYTEENCALHAAVIAGSRKLPNGSCQYLLRNSAGTGCEKFKVANFDSSLECEEETGQIWIPAERLGTSFLDLTLFL